MEKVDKAKIQNRINEIESLMLQNDFWLNKDFAQKTLDELDELKDALEGVSKYDKYNAIMTIFAGVGGEDAEDWVRILLEMYIKYSNKQKWQINFLDENKNSNSGYKTVTFELIGKNVYGLLKHEAGVHRLVRKSPFNSAGKRQTSFAMVEVLPIFPTESEFKIKDDDLDIQFTKSSGPGGQNVNKRETAVRVVHKPTGISAFVSNERSQAQNKDKALELIHGKIYNIMERQKKTEIADLSISKNTDATWGSQIRSYVLHPYKLVKDHRNKTETSDVESVLSGEIDLFIQAMKQ